MLTCDLFAVAKLLADNRLKIHFCYNSFFPAIYLDFSVYLG